MNEGTRRTNSWLTDQKKVFETDIELDLGFKGILKITKKADVAMERRQRILMGKS